MEPPSWVCRKVAEVHPQARLAWDGDLGKYGLIQLYSKRDASATFREPWNSRGPIFSKSGRPAPDWDLLSRIPIYLIELNWQDVHSGKIVQIVKRWVRPIAARIHESALEKGKATESKVQDMEGELAAKIYKEGQANGAGAPIEARKFYKKPRNSLRREAGELDFTKKHLPVAPPGGWKKYLDRDSKMDKGLEHESGATQG